MNAKDVVNKLRTTYRSKKTLKTRSLQWRIKQLNGILTFLNEKESEINKAIAEDLGKSAFMLKSTELTSVVIKRRLKNFLHG